MNETPVIHTKHDWAYNLMVSPYLSTYSSAFLRMESNVLYHENGKLTLVVCPDLEPVARFYLDHPKAFTSFVFLLTDQDRITNNARIIEGALKLKRA